MSDFTMCEALRATRDADSCLRGLNEFRRALRGDAGPAFLARYLRQSPEWQELQAVWDAQLTVSAAAAAAAARPCPAAATHTSPTACLCARRAGATLPRDGHATSHTSRRPGHSRCAA